MWRRATERSRKRWPGSENIQRSRLGPKSEPHGKRLWFTTEGLPARDGYSCRESRLQRSDRIKVCTKTIHPSREESGTSNPFRGAPRIFVPALSGYGPCP